MRLITADNIQLSDNIRGGCVLKIKPVASSANRLWKPACNIRCAFIKHLLIVHYINPSDNSHTS